MALPQIRLGELDLRSLVRGPDSNLIVEHKWGKIKPVLRVLVKIDGKYHEVTLGIDDKVLGRLLRQQGSDFVEALVAILFECAGVEYTPADNTGIKTRYWLGVVNKLGLGND